MLRKFVENVQKEGNLNRFTEIILCFDVRVLKLNLSYLHLEHFYHLGILLIYNR